jgi:organic radical activating enzyme
VSDREHHEELTQLYSTWGDKLLQHADRLNEIQNERVIRPITIQISPTEGCQSSCPFCSVSGRPLNAYMPYAKIVKLLEDFKSLGAKSIELTGGGNPLLYKDRVTKQNINDVISIAHSLGYEIGIITNSEKLTVIDKQHYDKISWIRISLIRLDEGCEPEDYDFKDFPYEKLGFSYIVYDECASDPVRKRYYEGTSESTIAKIAKLVELHSGKIKFVRFAGDCLIKGNNSLVRRKFGDVIQSNDTYKKFFLKTIDTNDDAFKHGCYVGMIRPYIAPAPDGSGYNVYICTSHVLNSRTYDKDYSLCSVDNVIEAWNDMNKSFRSNGYPYSVRGNCGKNWNETCKYCYYSNNNKLLHTVANEMPDKNFP